MRRHLLAFTGVLAITSSMAVNASGEAAILLKESSSENHEALRTLGHFYRHGIGVPHDDATAFNLTLKAAKLGNNEAMLALGSDYYKNGAGCAPNKIAAAFWLHSSMSQGNGRAALDLGDLYFESDDLSTKGLAFICYNDKSCIDSSNAKYRIARCYEIGAGCELSLEKAIKYYAEAEKKGNPLAKRKMAEIANKKPTHEPINNGTFDAKIKK